MSFYNGFSPAERRAWSGVGLPIPAQCALCRCGPERPLAYHCEDYRLTESAYAICRRCHYAIHIRFLRPDHWQSMVRQYQYPGAWFTLLSLDPASRQTPYDRLYPHGLPPAFGALPSLSPSPLP